MYFGDHRKDLGLLATSFVHLVPIQRLFVRVVPIQRPPRSAQPPREPTHLLGHAVRADFALRRRRRATESDATLAKLAKRHRETGREGRHGAKVALQLER